MDKERFELGLKQRKSTLGAEYVERNLAAADDFTKPFQERNDDRMVLGLRLGR